MPVQLAAARRVHATDFTGGFLLEVLEIPRVVPLDDRRGGVLTARVTRCATATPIGVVALRADWPRSFRSILVGAAMHTSLQPTPDAGGAGGAGGASAATIASGAPLTDQTSPTDAVLAAMIDNDPSVRADLYTISKAVGELAPLLLELLAEASGPRHLSKLRISKDNAAALQRCYHAATERVAATRGRDFLPSDLLRDLRPLELECVIDDPCLLARFEDAGAPPHAWRAPRRIAALIDALVFHATPAADPLSKSRLRRHARAELIVHRTGTLSAWMPRDALHRRLVEALATPQAADDAVGDAVDDAVDDAVVDFLDAQTASCEQASRAIEHTTRLELGGKGGAFTTLPLAEAERALAAALKRLARSLPTRCTGSGLRRIRAAILASTATGARKNPYVDAALLERVRHAPPSYAATVCDALQGSIVAVSCPFGNDAATLVRLLQTTNVMACTLCTTAGRAAASAWTKALGGSAVSTTELVRSGGVALRRSPLVVLDAERLTADSLRALVARMMAANECGTCLLLVGNELRSPRGDGTWHALFDSGAVTSRRLAAGTPRTATQSAQMRGLTTRIALGQRPFDAPAHTNASAKQADFGSWTTLDDATACESLLGRHSELVGSRFEPEAVVTNDAAVKTLLSSRGLRIFAPCDADDAAHESVVCLLDHETTRDDVFAAAAAARSQLRVICIGAHSTREALDFALARRAATPASNLAMEIDVAFGRISRPERAVVGEKRRAAPIERTSHWGA